MHVLVPRNNIFYRPIRKWAAQPGRSLGEMSTAKMENTLFIDLSVKLGQPYCYLHQGNCEHLVIFSDVRYDFLAMPLMV